MKLRLRSLFLTLFALVLTSTNTFSQTATIATDALDYPPGSTAIITGTGFQPGETVTLQVLHDPAGGDDATDPSHLPFTVIADATGNVSSSWMVPGDADELGATLKLTAVGQTSGLTASEVFTDAIHFQSILVGAQGSTLIYGASGNTTYLISAGFNGSGGAVTVALNYAFSPSIPSGVTSPSGSHFSLNPLSSSSTFSTLTITTDGTTAVGSYNFSVSGVGSDGTNLTSSTKTLTITKATTIISSISGTGIYGANATLTATVNLNVAGLPIAFTLDGTSVGSANTNAAGVATLVVPFATIPATVKNVGTYANKVGASIANTTNYSAASGTGALTISKANQTITWANPADITYGTTLGVTQLNATVAGVSGGSAPGGLTYSPLAATLLSAGNGQNLHVDAAATSNYNAASKDVTINVLKANQTITWSNPSDITYGTVLGVTQLNATVLGVSGGSAPGGLTYSPLAAKLLSAGNGQNLHVDAAATSNYNAASKDVTINVLKANQTITWSNPSDITYGTVLGVTQLNATVSGVSGGSAPGGLTYSPLAATLLSAGNGQNLHVDAAATSNYNAASKDVTINVLKANPTVSVTPYNVTYDANAHTATGNAKGIGGVILSGLDLSGTTHSNAGTYSGDTWAFTDATGNYNNANGSVDDAISKADATVSVNGYSGTYDGTAHGAAGTAKGVGGVDLSSGLNLGTTFTYVPGGSAHWTFSGGSNYNDQSGDVSIVINTRTLTISGTGINKVYDGTTAAMVTLSDNRVTGDVFTDTYSGATFSDKNVGTGKTVSVTGISISGTNAGNYTFNTTASTNASITRRTLNITATGINKVYDGTTMATVTLSDDRVSGDVFSAYGYGTATFSDKNVGTGKTISVSNIFFGGGDAINYLGNTLTTTTADITKANPTVTVTPYSVTYDGAAHTATYIIAGVNGETDATVGTIDVSGTSHTNAGTYTADAWNFTGAANYNNTSGSVSDVITKADATISVNGYTGVYDGNAHGATGTAKGVKAESLTGLDLGASFTIVPGGTATWKYTDATGNYNDATGTAAIVITKANATISVNGYTGVYDGNAHGATGTAKGVKGEALAGLDLGASFTNVPGGTATWKYTDATGNYNDATGTAAIVITKADATISVNGYTGVYDGNAHGATGTAKGVKGEALAGLDLGASFTNVPGGTATWKYTDATGNYNDATGTAAIVITKADATISVNGYTGVYDGNAHGATGTAKGVKGEALAGLDLGASFTNVPGGTASWKYTDVTGNYNDATGTAAIVITKADPSITVTPYSVTYDGNAHTATYTITGVKSEVLSGMDVSATTHTAAGTYASDAWAFSDVTGNYNNKNGTVSDAIGKADPTINVTPYSVTYDGNAHTATYTITGVKSEVLSGMDVSATTHTAAGTYASDAWAFSDVTGNYNNKNGTVSDAIAKANPSITVNGYNGIYDGNAHGATGTAVGVKGESLTGLDLGASFTNVPGGTASWKYTDVTGNYNDATGTAAIVITKADPSITVTPYSVTYDGNAHTATYTITGVKSEVLSGMDVSATTHTAAGTYASDAWAFSDVTGNYNNKNGTVSDAISKADPTINVTPYSVTYDGNAHTATYTVTGVKSEVLSGMDVSATTHTAAGTYASDAWAFSDVTGNYNNKNGTVSDAISKADPTINVTPYSVTYDGNAHTATYTITGVKSEVLSGMDVSATTHTAAGTYASDAWAFSDVTGNYNNKNGTVSDAIAKANPSITVNGYNGIYDGNAHGATGTAVGVKGESLTGLDLGASFTNVPGGTASWKYTDVTGNYNDATGTAAIVITKADPSITVTPYSVTYDGNAHTATYTITGVKSEVLSGMDVSATTHTAAGTYASDAWAFSDVTGNYNNKNGTVSDAISKADPTINVTPYSVTYDGNAHTATYAVTGVKSEVLSGMDVSATTHTAAGTYASDAWAFSDVTGNYNNKNGTVSDAISKADPTINVTPYSVTYDGNAHTATYTITGVKSEVLSGMDVSATTHTAAGTYASDAWAFSDVTGNYNNKNGTVSDAIGKADPTINVTPYSVTYDGNAHTATYTITGVKSEVLSGMDVSATTHTAAGTYASDAWAFSDVTGNYNNKNGTVSDAIGKADPTINVTPYSVTYDGNAHTATYTVTGVKGETLSGMNVSATTHTAAGTYATDAWTFTDVTGNYNNKNGTVSDKINKADPTITVTPYSVTYDGNAHTATYTITGVKSEVLSGMDVSATTHTAAGTYASDAWAFSDVTGNYNNKNGTVSDAIGKADPTINVTPYSVTYDGNAHTATYTITGVKSEVLSGMDVSATTHTAAGTYASDAWAFSDVTGNYNNKNGTVSDAIGKADPTINVTPYSVTYDGNAHTATYTVTGVKGETLSGMNVSATTHTAAGTYATDAWTFTDVTGNYNNKNGTVSDKINKADPTITVTPYSVTYDGNAHTATYTITGVKSEVLSGMDVSATTHTAAGTYASDAWAFSDVTGNYNNKNGTVSDAIGKADPTINVTPYSVTYDGNAHTATYTITGVKSEVLSGMDVSATTHTAAGTYASDAWAFSDVTGNYNNKNGTVSDAISKADPTINVTPYSVTYDGNAHTATYTVTGVKGETLSGMNVSATTHTAAGTYATDAWTFTDVTGNYNNKNGTVSDKINKADPTITVTPYSVTYDGNAHTATYTVTGVKGETLSGMDVSATTHTAAGTYASDAWTFTDVTGNYNNKNGTVGDKINKADPTITVTPYSVTYDGNAHTATYTVTGVKGETLSGMNVSATTHTAAGTYATDAWTFTDVTGNYNNKNGTVGDVINKRTITVTAVSKTKYCGQVDPSLTYNVTSGTVVTGDSFTGVLLRATGENSGVGYLISQNTLSLGSNYVITYVPAYLTISSVNIDASASATAIPINTASTPLSALVTSGGVPVAGSTVWFTVTNNINGIITNVVNISAVTGTNGVASTPIPTSALSTGLYDVNVVAGASCSSSSASYFSVYDPNAGFVTGGGWITSPVVPSLQYMTVGGKANFGFNAQYHKGSNAVDGNTQFQFQAGNLNFNSSAYNAGTLVIAGAKAIFQGTGTINGNGTYNFMISAIDGSINGGVDKFRIKIWNTAGTVVYDNNVGADNNADPSTALGGGSIVIHNANSNKTALDNNLRTIISNVAIQKLAVKVMPNPSSNYFTLGLNSGSNEKVTITVVDIAGRTIELRNDVSANSNLQLGSSYHPGVYFAQVVQGKDIVILKLIKEGK